MCGPAGGGRWRRGSGAPTSRTGDGAPLLVALMASVIPLVGRGHAILLAAGRSQAGCAPFRRVVLARDRIHSSISDLTNRIARFESWIDGSSPSRAQRRTVSELTRN